MEIKKIGIAGAGLMGASMSQIFAKYGYDVTVYDAFDTAIEKGKNLVKVNQAAAVESGEATQAEADKVIAALKFTNDINDLRKYYRKTRYQAGVLEDGIRTCPSGGNSYYKHVGYFNRCYC